MDTQVINEIRECLPRGRTIFPYFKDRYALMLLSYLARQSQPIAQVKRSRFAPLLNKPAVRDALAHRGDGRMDATDFDYHWPRADEPSQVEQFLLTIGRWGCDERLRDANSAWWQTSRPGWNLVLQLNFSTAYEDTLKQVLKVEPDAIIANSESHPVRVRRRDAFFRETLAWARIDLDFKTNEALIEEVQSDWVRWVAGEIRCWLRDQLNALPEQAKRRRQLLNERAKRYVDNVLPRYRTIWQEAMLASAITFIRDELGIGTIFYHTYESGLAAKQLAVNYGPPRSLYTDLPRRFCFEKTQCGPQFLHAEPRLAQRGRHRNERRLGTRRDRLKNLWWHQMAM